MIKMKNYSKRLIMFLIALLACWGSCSAQIFQVYAVKGEVKCNDGQSETMVAVGMMIPPTTEVSVPEGSRLVVLNEADKQLRTIKNAVSGPIAELLKQDNVSVQQLTDSYLSYIKSKMLDSGNPKDSNYRQSAGTSYRDPDSLLLHSLFPKDTLKNSTNQ